jgi:SpoVK/Ycf46/Vps4 family AAA+-type ATPase
VLLDAFDEMVRARESGTDVLSRFLTTAMLPKLHKINDNRRLAFIVATNRIDAFDVAIKRPGRFDIILQVMPPTSEEKLRKWSELSELTAAGVKLKQLKDKLAPLTYAETETLVRRLRTSKRPRAKLDILNAAYEKCTLMDMARLDDNSEKKWKDICDEQRDTSRIS